MANHLVRNLRRRLSNAKSEDGGSMSGLGSPSASVLKMDEELPSLKSISNVAKRLELLRQKLAFCSELANFGSLDARDKAFVANKRKALMDLVDFLNSGPARSKQEYFTEPVLLELMTMVRCNIFVALPPQLEDYDPDEDEPWLDATWPHKQVVYELLLRLVVSADFPAKAGKKQGLVDQDFCIGLVGLFESDDPRERDYLKTILHRIYGKFMAHRAFIRKQISFVFAQFVVEGRRQNGIAELLEILGSIINGFALPLKPEHLGFVEASLIPLHKSPWVGSFTSQLTYCITQYIEKDANTGRLVVEQLFRLWPWANSQKQVMFLNELEEVLELVPPNVLQETAPALFKGLSRCISSDHFQVCERTLFLWNNEHIVNLFATVHGAGASAPAGSGAAAAAAGGRAGGGSFDMVLAALARNVDASGPHWNSAVTLLSFNVIEIYKERFGIDVDAVARAMPSKQPQVARAAAREERWRQMEAQARGRDATTTETKDA